MGHTLGLKCVFRGSNARLVRLRGLLVWLMPARIAIVTCRRRCGNTTTVEVLIKHTHRDRPTAARTLRKP